MQISSTFNLVWKHSDQVFWISRNSASYGLAKVLILGGHLPPSVSVVEKRLAMERLPSNHLYSSIRTSHMRKLLWGMTSLEFFPFSSIFHWFAGDHKLQIYLLGFWMSKKTKARRVSQSNDHKGKNSSITSHLGTSSVAMLSDRFLSKKERKCDRKPLYEIKNPQECWRSKNSSQLFPGICVILPNSHLPVKRHCLTYYHWGFKTCKDVWCSRAQV